jgi:membrane protein insertase Oxa1/YidC/SpoIIIJ
MPDISIVFSPIVWVLDLVLHFYRDLTGSLGVSILLLSATFSLLLAPLQKAGMRLEKRITEKMKFVQGEVHAAKASGLKGEALFLKTERIYKEHRYHPIHAVVGGASFFAMLPILISSIILFQNSPELPGQSFLFISDLSQPDQTFGPHLNVLPFLMFGITLVDALLRYPGDRGAQVRFLVISVVLLVLVYALPSALVLYWIGSNLTSFALARLAALRARTT